jgi:hypothetical protein
MDSPALALVASSALVALAVLLRLAVRSRAGTLDWERERPVLIAAPLIVLSLVLVTAGGPIAQSVVPPLVIAVSGLGLAFYGGRTPARFGGLALRTYGYMALLGGILGLAAAAARLFVG